MAIAAKSLRTMKKVAKAAGNAEEVRLAVSVENFTPEDWVKLGFGEELHVGDYIIPSDIGRFTSFNAHGKEVLRPDLPKVPKSYMYSTTITDWHGNPHEVIASRTREVTATDYISAPSEYLHVVEIMGRQYIATSPMTLHEALEAENLHLCNLMLECFGTFEIVDLKSNEVISPKLTQLQWDILPKGEYPWEKTKVIISSRLSKLPKRKRDIIEYRIEIITRYKPDFIAMGRGGFSGYFVYGFESKKKYILESTNLDNATYIFNDDWEELSKLTKNEILNGEKKFIRILHNKDWENALKEAIK